MNIICYTKNQKTKNTAMSWNLAKTLNKIFYNRKGNPGIVDSLGNFFPVQEMHQSEVFRRGQQKYLIVADNRTREYKQASATRKASLSHDSWKQIK